MVVFYDVFTDSEIGFTKMHELFAVVCLGGLRLNLGLV